MSRNGHYPSLEAIGEENRRYGVSHIRRYIEIRFYSFYIMQVFIHSFYIMLSNNKLYNPNKSKY